MVISFLVDLVDLPCGGGVLIRSCHYSIHAMTMFDMRLVYHGLPKLDRTKIKRLFVSPCKLRWFMLTSSGKICVLLLHRILRTWSGTALPRSADGAASHHLRGISWRRLDRQPSQARRARRLDPAWQVVQPTPTVVARTLLGAPGIATRNKGHRYERSKKQLHRSRWPVA